MASRPAQPPAGRLGAAAWSDRNRSRSRRLDPALLEEARRNSEAASQDTGFLFSLADEIARTRAPELCRGHRTLVTVMPGFKNTRRRGERPASDVPRPCVVLVVRRKRDLACDHPDRLPSYLVTYAKRKGRRMAFAIPTDVQDAGEHRHMRTHAASEMWAQRPGFSQSFGHFAALVRCNGDPSTYMLSAMHVVSPNIDTQTFAPLQLDLLPMDEFHVPVEGPLLANGQSFGGMLMPDSGNGEIVSFDVQLARVDDAQLAGVLAKCPLRGLDEAHAIAMNAVDLAAMTGQANRFELLRADNNPLNPAEGPVLLSLSASPPEFDLPYDFGEGTREVQLNVLQKELLRFDAITDVVPRGGDSGSAIVFRQNIDGRVTLVAMHIAGDGNGASLAIPAWRLFNTSLWAMPPQGALSIVDPG